MFGGSYQNWALSFPRHGGKVVFFGRYGVAARMLAEVLADVNRVRYQSEVAVTGSGNCKRELGTIVLRTLAIRETSGP